MKTLFAPCKPCCGNCIEGTIGLWWPPDYTDQGEIVEVDEYDNPQIVQMVPPYQPTISDRRRTGYHLQAHFRDLVVGRAMPDTDVVSLFLDGGSHEVRLRYESFAAAHTWGYACQSLHTMTLLVQLWRGVTKLAESRVPQNIGTAGLSIDAVFGSLLGTTFCGGFANNAVTVPYVTATTTETHNGGDCWVEILDKGANYHYRTYNGGTVPLLETIEVTRLWLRGCKTQCPSCTYCEDSGLPGSLSVFLPTYAMALFGGGSVVCNGGTFVADYYQNCRWSHASDSALIYLGFASAGGSLRLAMQVVSCKDYSCSGFEVPLYSTWLSDPLPSPVLCNDFTDIELRTTVNGVTYTAEVSSV